MPNDTEPDEPSLAPAPPDIEPADRDERKVRAFQHLIKGAIADKDLLGTGVVRKLDAALRGEALDSEPVTDPAPVTEPTPAPDEGIDGDPAGAPGS
jgi:hypothetical protein